MLLARFLITASISRQECPMPRPDRPSATAATYAAAFSLLRGVRFALILADTDALAATAQAGRVALEQLLAAAGDTPVVICSAHDPARFVGHAARGFAGFLAKPFDLAQLGAAVRHAIAFPAR
jgi:DNA-binding NarL/FixJ family response regulator